MHFLIVLFVLLVAG